MRGVDAVDNMDDMDTMDRMEEVDSRGAPHPLWVFSIRNPQSTIRNPVAGYSLLEMLMFVAVFAVAVNLCGALLLTSSRLAAMNTLALDRLNAVREVQDGFKTAIQESAGKSEAPWGLSPTDGRLWLRLPAQEPGQSAAYRVFGLLADGQRLVREDFLLGPGAPENYVRTWPLRVKNLRFSNVGAAIKMSFEIQEDEGERPSRQVIYETIATPRMN
ncbi:MAG: hypothetical protein HYV26_20985 [Candidatus Hydrogenedentes bacterium]|nr:hypothetical protein [Candidatus Hydrogenedentota bacterium]